jgi:hypothetical protein
VILGHVDSPSGPAVFSKLANLRRGDEIVVARRDRSRATFVVERVEHHARTEFPTLDVYFPHVSALLRLITCTGRYIRSAGGYQANLVVFAALRVVMTRIVNAWSRGRRGAGRRRDLGSARAQPPPTRTGRCASWTSTTATTRTCR